MKFSKKSKVIMIFLSLFMISLSFLSSLKADELNSNDIQNAQILADAGVIVDNEKNPSNYNLKANISRREMLKIMLNIAGVEVSDVCEGKFADLSSDDWGCKYAEKALELGFIAANEYFRPDDNVSKAESLKMIFKAKGIEVPKTTDWREGYVQKGVELGYTDKFNDYDTAGKRSFVFGVGARTIQNFGSIVEEKVLSYEKPKLLITFEKDMDKTSVLSNLKVYPEIAYTTDWVDDKNLELVIDDIISQETEFLVNVLDEAITSSGETLEETYTKKFKIDGEAMVDFVSPSGEITDLNKNITVRFSKPIVPLTNLDNGEKCPIEITPNIPGKCVWITTSTFQFRPEKGFPTGGNYSVVIPANIETIAGDKTINSKSFKITTPDFVLVSQISNINKDDKLNFAFNDEISLEDFKNNFSMDTFSNDKLDFIYYKGESDLEESTNIVSIFPKTGDWGYSKYYNYTIKGTLTSSRGNVGLGNDISRSFRTNDFLLDYETFVFYNEDLEDKYTVSNMRFGQNSTIITKENPSILFEFYKEVDLDKDIFSTNLNFSLNYAKDYDYEISDYKENKKKIVLTFSSSIQNELDLKLDLSKYATNSDKELHFSTKEKNEIFSFNQVNYKKACLETQNSIFTNNLGEYFEYDKYSQISYVRKVNQYTKDEDCAYTEGKNTYILTTNLNPETDYNLTIKSDLPDTDNYGLDKDYSYSFSTLEALNEDKEVSIIDGRNLILVPNEITPLSVGLQSVNLDEISVNVCVGDLDVLSDNYLKNEDCTKKTIEINNLGFKPNVSIIDLEEVYGEEIEKKYVTLEVSKIDNDLTQYEAKTDYHIKKASFVISDIGATIKSSKNVILWLHNFSSGEDVTDQVEKIEAYKTESVYSIFGNYKGQEIVFEKEISFITKTKGIYELQDTDFNILLITLKSGEQILLDDVYARYYDRDSIYTYVSTDKPIYKAGDTVNISGISKILTAKGYNLNSGTVNIYVRDSNYEEILDTTVSLNNLGAFNLSFDLEEDASLGNYFVDVSGSSLSFAVEEYEKPDFRLETTTSKDNYLYGEKAQVNALGEYYIGLPLASGEGSYSLTSKEFYFDGGKTTGYTFGEQRYFWRNYYRYDNDYDSYEISDDFVLDSSGNATINIDLEESSKDKIYTVSTTVTDPNTKKSISSNTSFKALRSDTFLGIKFDKYYYSFKDIAAVGFVTTDVEGNKLSDKTFDFKVYKIDYEYDENTYGFTTKETLVLEKELQTDSSGLTSESFEFSDYGEYKFEIETAKYKTTKTIYVSGGDLLRPIDAGHNIEVLSDKDIYDIGDKMRIAISSPVKNVKALLTIEKLDEVLNYSVIDINNYSQEIEIDVRKEYLPNVEVKIYIIKDIESVSDNLEELKTLRLEMNEIEQELQTEEVNYIPYLTYDLSYKKGTYVQPCPEGPGTDGTCEETSTDLLLKLQEKRLEERELLNKILPEYFVGTKDINLNIDSIELTSEVQLEKESYLPGDSQKIELDIVDNDGNPISGEITLAIVDKSLLALKNNDTDVINFFYSEKRNDVRTFGNLENLIKRIEYAEELKDEDSLDDSDDGSLMLNSVEKSMPITADTADMDDEESIFYDMAFEGESANSKEILGMATGGGDNLNATKLRTEFKDLAFYKALVKVENGKATLEVSALPDNLTTWVISGFAYTNDGKVGNFKTEFKVQKELSQLSQIPRFFLGGDEAQISTLVVNNTTTQKDVDVSFDMTEVEIVGEKTKNVIIEPNSSELVSFDVKVSDLKDKSTTSTISITAKENMPLELSRYPLEDSVEITKPIYPSKTSEYVFTNGSTEDLSYEEKLDFEDVEENGGYLEINLGATILTNLTKNLDKVLYFPSESLNSKLNFLENAMALEELYEKIGKTSEFENIILTDYNLEEYKVKEVMSLVKNDIQNFLQLDGGLSYFKDCVPSWFMDTCSNLNITGKFLNLNIEVSGVSNNSVLKYYKEALVKRIEEQREYTEYTEVDDFFPIALYKETSFINEYFNPNPELSNLGKLDYIKLYNLLGTTGEKTSEYITDLKNSTLIEARGTVLPAIKSYVGTDNSVASARMIGVLIDTNDGEKLLLENLVRFLISNRDDEGNYYTYSFSEVIKAINKYVEFTNELENVDFVSKTYLNNKEVLSSNFGESNKFEIDKEIYNFEDYLVSGENSLGFEKTGNGKLYYDVGVRYYLPVSEMNSREEGITVSRNYYNYDEYNNAYKKSCITPWWYYDFGGYCTTQKTKNIDSIKEATKGDYIVGEIQIILDRERDDVVINDYLPAGAEVLNTNFDTTSSEIKEISGQDSSGWWYRRFDHIEQKDDRIYLYASYLKAGTYTYTYVLKASHIGTYNLKPATAELIDKSEIWGRSTGGVFEIK